MKSGTSHSQHVGVRSPHQSNRLISDTNDNVGIEKLEKNSKLGKI